MAGCQFLPQVASIMIEKVLSEYNIARPHRAFGYDTTASEAAFLPPWASPLVDAATPIPTQGLNRTSG